METRHSSCTTILVGKKASLDGPVMAARNDDTFLPVTPQRYVVYPAYHNHPNQVKSYLNHFVGDRPADGYRYQGIPNVELTKEGVYDENGFNEKNVAMSATESVYANERVLAFDPLNTESGINEDVIVALTLPFINSAREGVQYLGQQVAKYGSAEGNGVIFADKNEVWYMEIVTGHHWVAQRIPDDCYALTGNRIAIQEVNFDDPDNFMWSDGIQAFVADHHLNPDREGWNFRRIFGTSDVFDQHYNTPRQWYGHKLFNPELKFEPTDFDLPFVMKSDRLISLEDVEYYLSSHYQNTPYDPLGHDGTEREKHLYRPISLNRTQNSHVLQINPNLPEHAQTIMWMTFGGVPTFTPYLPLFGNADEADARMRNTPVELDLDDPSFYWLFNRLAVMVEAHHAEFAQADLDYLKDLRQYFHTWVAKTAEKTAGMDAKAATVVLNKAQTEMLDKVEHETKRLLAKLITQGISLSKLTFKMDVNL